MREISSLCQWSISSFKSGFGVPELLNKDLEQYWQSDGPQPHYINLKFNRTIWISRIDVYLDYRQDESYTPRVLHIKAGVAGYLETVLVKEVFEPTGWVELDLELKTHWIQIQIVQNHQNGKDTHIRSVRVYQ
ncbi:anaphase-promoting complex, subunit 10/DOC domain-containing protein [Gorgonomyces haynaldii]|nr:anaphase-promoting complex, subunit 10/DOC domain-containing protein [Gorgonomyces haynaldii]